MKIKKVNDILDQINIWKKQGKKIVTCNGSYDLIHPGHIGFFKKAKQEGDILIVGINSDKSYMEYKHGQGPILSEKDRAIMVSSVRYVDEVFIFDETTPISFINKIKPDFHANGANYTKECIEGKAVRANGGKLVLIDNIGNFSSTNMVKKIVDRYGKQRSKAIFLDRDGTINVDHDYVYKTDKYELIPNAIKGLKKFQKNGFKLIIITSQSGIGRGYYSENDMEKFNDHLLEDLKKNGIKIEEIYYCPHHPESKIEKYKKHCDCRKPGPVLFEKAKKEHNIDMENSYVIGDKTSDILAGNKVGLKTILVKTGKAGMDKQYDIKPDYIAKDLLDAYETFIKKESN